MSKTHLYSVYQCLQKVDHLDFFPTFYNMQSVSSNAVAQKLNDYATNTSLRSNKYYRTTSREISAIGWYKIAELGYRNYGFSLSLDLCSAYENTPSGSHKIQINYGWLSARVIDIAKDTSGVFDKIQIVYNSNNTDVMAIYVHYNKSYNNPVYLNINSCVPDRFTLFNFAVDTLTWQNALTVNLGTDGIYENGTKLT